MARIIKLIGFLILIGFGVYVYALLDQTQSVANLCDSYPAGSQIENLEKLEKSYGLKLIGPIDIGNKPGTQKAIFCAVLSMCDTSCTIEFQNGRVTHSNYSNI